MKKVFQFITSKYHRFIDFLRYRSAVKKAQNAWRKSNQRYYVMPVSSKTEIKLILVDRKNFRILKRKGYINSLATVDTLVQECFYCTPYGNGNGYLNKKGMSIKFKQYLQYCEAQRAIIKMNKLISKAKKNGKEGK